MSHIHLHLKYLYLYLLSILSTVSQEIRLFSLKNKIHSFGNDAGYNGYICSDIAECIFCNDCYMHFITRMELQ